MKSKRHPWLIILLSTVVWFGQAKLLKADDAEISRDALRKGSWSLQFGVGSNFTLNNFQGATFSGKYQLTNQSALQAGISPSYSRDLTKGAVLYGSDSRKSSIRIAAHYLHYFKPPKRVNGYIGGGPEFSYERDRSGSDYSSYVDVWSLGAAFMLGAEWFATKDICFFAEYGVLLEYGSQDAIRSGKKYASEETSTFGSRNVVLGISIYL
jgi:hypothetical protein